MIEQTIQELIDTYDGNPWIEPAYQEAKKRIPELGYTIKLFFNRNDKDHYCAVKGDEIVYPSFQVERGLIRGYNVTVYFDLHANVSVSGIILKLSSDETGRFQHTDGKTYIVAQVFYPGKGSIWHVVTEYKEEKQEETDVSNT